MIWPIKVIQGSATKLCSQLTLCALSAPATRRQLGAQRHWPTKPAPPPDQSVRLEINCGAGAPPSCCRRPTGAPNNRHPVRAGQASGHSKLITDFGRRQHSTARRLCETRARLKPALLCRVSIQIDSFHLLFLAHRPAPSCWPGRAANLEAARESQVDAMGRGASRMAARRPAGLPNGETYARRAHSPRSHFVF